MRGSTTNGMCVDPSSLFDLAEPAEGEGPFAFDAGCPQDSCSPLAEPAEGEGQPAFDAVFPRGFAFPSAGPAPALPEIA